MSFLRVVVDSLPLATVASAGREFLTARVGGTIVDDDYADLTVSSYNRTLESEPESLTWINQMPLRAGQCIEIAFLENGAESEPGKTFEELYPNHEGKIEPIDKASLFADIRKYPKLRNGYTLAYLSNSIANQTFATAPGDHGFLLNVLWNFHHPDRVSVSFHSYTISGVEAEEPAHYFVRERLGVGSSVKLQLVS